MNIEPIKKAQKGADKQHYIYKVSADNLLKVFQSNNWLDATADLVNHEIDDDADYDIGVDKTNKSVDVNAEFRKQIDELKHMLFLAENKEEYKKLLYIQDLRDKCKLDKLSNESDDIDNLFDDIDFTKILRNNIILKIEYQKYYSHYSAVQMTFEQLTKG